eukprot:scaffold3466_cov80-Attheya_sp.AAC.2
MDVRNRHDWFLRFEPWFHGSSGMTRRFVAESIQSKSLVKGGGIDASRPYGANAGIFIGIGRLVVEFSPLFHPVYRIKLEMDGLHQCALFLCFEPWSAFCKWMAVC